MALQSFLLTVLNNVAHEKENPFNCRGDKLLTSSAKEPSLTWCKTLFSFIYYPAYEVIYPKSAVTPSQDWAMCSLFKFQFNVSLCVLKK